MVFAALLVALFAALIFATLLDAASDAYDLARSKVGKESGAQTNEVRP